MAIITLTPLASDDREQFILDNQRAFKFGAMEEFGKRDDHLSEDGEIISRATIERCIDNGEAYRIRADGEIVGGLVLKIDEKTWHNHLELLFIAPDAHSKGIGQAAWKAVERLYPQTRVWETCTLYFETRNIHFYVNKCGFHIVEFFNSHHPEPNDHEAGEKNDGEESDFDGMFRFEKCMCSNKSESDTSGGAKDGKEAEESHFRRITEQAVSPLWESILFLRSKKDRRTRCFQNIDYITI